MPANPTRRLVRLATLAALALLLQGSECDKERDFFALDGEDGTSTTPDVTPPVIDNFQPSGEGVFAVDNFMFEVTDQAATDGANVTGLDPASVSVTNAQTFPVTLDGSMATVDLSGTPDGMHTFDIRASDMAGNTAMSTFSLNLDWTAPVVDFTSAPPSSAETDDETFEFFAAWTVSDPNFQAGVYTFLDPGSNGACDPDDPLWPEGSDPGQVDQNTFSTPQPGSFEIRGTFTNPLDPDDSPLTQTICGRYQATDTALGKTGQPNPNTFDEVFGLSLTWFPPMPTTGRIVGTVTADGSPASGVTLTLDGDPSMTTTTDGSGMYAFNMVSQGDHTVTVTPPSGTTCDPQSQSVNVPAGGEAMADFACSSATTFSVTIATGWNHPAGSSTSIACGAFGTSPAQPGASFTAQLTGSGVIGSGTVQGSTDSQGGGTFQADISQTGDYMWDVTVNTGAGGTEQASQSFTVTGAQNSCPTMVQSSMRFKQGVRPLLPHGVSVAGLRPVAFRYLAPYGDPAVLQVGLIAEEVVRVYPGAVVLDGAGRPAGIRYDILTGLVVREAGRRLVEMWREGFAR